MKKINWIIPSIAFTALLACILASKSTYRIGFPLDDAWIHQTYARNLAMNGEFTFIPGMPSAGSTSPLWTWMLVPGHWIGGAGIYIWTFFLGVASLVALALVGERLFRLMVTPTNIWLPVAGLLLVSEWHLVWAAASGMETTLYSAAILLIFFLAWHERSPVWALGLLIGVAVWIRPDAITLFGPVGWMLLFQNGSSQNRLKRLGWMIGGSFLLIAAYLMFNRLLSGSLWPTTFYAKQAEYAILSQGSFISRYFRIATLPLVGVGTLLLPGFIFQFWNIVKNRNWRSAAMMLWWLGYTGIYAFRLPVGYQHGRYLIPAMPIFFLLGLSGSLAIYQSVKISQRWKRRLKFASTAAIFLVSLAFLISGIRAYAEDVAVIESEMVDTARWLQINTEPDALLAVHDIGAVGYFSQRKIIDLAGLVSPEVIPFIRDETRLAEYLDAKKVNYLVTFPDWYHELPEGKEVVYQTDGKFSPAQGGTNMTVYRWETQK
ncbi:MAG TPA: hypothetical protein VN452_04170 [Longilinea sp.]|nr:hypothetical protein [Longilinea sp.]